MEISYCELRNKEVVNVLNGKRLGRIVDLIISSRSCRVLGLVVPGCKKFFKTKDDIFIPGKIFRESATTLYSFSFRTVAGESASSGYDAPPPVVHERYAEDDE